MQLYNTLRNGDDDFVADALGDGMTLHAFYWTYDFSDMEEPFDRIASAGIKNLIFWIGSGEVFYPSNLMPRDPFVTGGFDPLQRVIDLAAEREMTTTVWWSVGTAMWDLNFYDLHSDWGIANKAGVPTSCGWLDFSLLEVRQFMTNVVAEIAAMYQVPLLLDYIRYPFPGIYAEHGCEGFDARDVFTKEDVSGAVLASYQAAQAAGIELHAAVLAGLTADTISLQYWREWVDDGYIDRVYPMAYMENPESLWYLDRFIPYWLETSRPEIIVPAIKVYNGEESTKVPKTDSQLLAEIEPIQAAGFEDVCIFNTLELTEDQITFLKEYFMEQQIPEHPRSAQDILNDIRLGNQSSLQELVIVQGDADTLTADVAALTDRYAAQDALIVELEEKLAAITGEVRG